MANTFNAGTQTEEWIRGVQKELRNNLIGLSICDVYSGPDRTIHYNFGTDVTAALATAGAYVPTDFTYSDDTLVVTNEGVVSERVRNYETLFENWSVIGDRNDRAAFALAKQIDTEVLGNYTNAGVTIDAGNLADPIGGTASGVPITLSDTNIDDMFDALVEALGSNDAQMDKGMFVVMRPKDFTKVNQYARGTGFQVADEAIKAGYKYTLNGVEIYVTNNVPDNSTGANDTAYLVSGIKGSIFLALPSGGMEIKTKDVTGFLGVELVWSQVFDSTVWTKRAPELVTFEVAI